jgi:PAS domain S-box-containing protein
VEISAKSIKIGDKKFVLSIERDITARKEAEQAIRESEEKFRVGFRSAPDALAIINLKTGKAVELNEGFEKLTGYTLEELKSKDDVFVPFKTQDALKQIKSVKYNKIEAANINMKITHKSGEIYHVLASASMISLNQTPHLLVVAKNITELKKTQDELIKAKEKAEESDRLKSAFLSNMSHEIRTPMNHIIGFTEFIKQGVSEEELQRYIEIIQRSGHHLLDLINDIIDISKIESGQFKLKTYIINPTIIMKELYEGFVYDKRIMENKEVELINDVKFTPGVKIRADKLRFRQILYNLIGNSIKFTRKGYIRYGFEDRNDGFLTFYVKDTGLGIAEKDIDLIFERFRQAGDAKLQSEGTGLGLALTKAFVELMGGRIWVESVQGEGSTFYFTIPVIKSETINDTGLANKNYADSRILLIGNDQTDVFLFTTFLKNFIKKEDIVNVIEPAEAVEFLKSDLFDVVVVNMENSGKSGLQSIEIIKEIYRDIPVLAITSYKGQVEDLRLFERGFDGIIEKPLSTDNIVNALKRFIKLPI